MLARVISGGQTGVDIAALRAARACGIATGGTAPRGWLTEDGPRPGLLQGFGLVEHASERYPARTRANVEGADLTLVIATELDGGSRLTVELCGRLGKPCLHLDVLDGRSLAAAADFVSAQHRGLRRALVLNVAGNRESKEPGIAARARSFLMRLFAALEKAPCSG